MVAGSVSSHSPIFRKTGNDNPKSGENLIVEVSWIIYRNIIIIIEYILIIIATNKYYPF